MFHLLGQGRMNGKIVILLTLFFTAVTELNRYSTYNSSSCLTNRGLGKNRTQLNNLKKTGTG